MSKSTSLSIQNMANLLEVRKKSHHHTVLLLGSRVGKLFRSVALYENLQLLSSRNFHQLSRINQFQECFRILASYKLDETDIHSILSASLRDMGNTNSDISLASLIRNAYFDEIVTTNIDDSLEDALLTLEMKEGRDYEVMLMRDNPLLYEEKSSFCRIIKVFGDIVSREYAIRGRAARLDNPEVKSFLHRLLRKDLLIVGLDPIWDQDILRIIPATTNAPMWLVNEEDISKELYIADLLRNRSSTYIFGSEGSYDHFIPKVHNYLLGSNSSPYQQHIAKKVDLLEEKVANLMTALDTMTERLTHLTTALSGMNDQLQAQQDKNHALLNEAFREIQEIRRDRDEGLTEQP